MIRSLLFCCACFLTFTNCNRKAQPYDFPQPIDTETKGITPPERKIWDLGNGVELRTDFPSARLTEVSAAAPGRITGFVPPENTPINKSPWYAFRVRSQVDTTLEIALRYPNSAFHRYWPKLSLNGKVWGRIDSTRFTISADSRLATLQLSLKANHPKWVAAQEIHDTRAVADWIRSLTFNPNVTTETIGESPQGRAIPKITIRRPGGAPRATMIILSRQHPPEVTGYLAMQAFVEGLLGDRQLIDLLKRYQIIIYPLLNPDGVDGGHWRHNAGGVDLNRDWAFYRQPETALVANDIVRTARKTRAPVTLGLDFHSTWKDVYYTHDASVQPPSVLGDFKDRWLAAIEVGIGGDFKINEEAEPIGRPTSMSWFRTQFNAEGITYEIGDDTPRDFVNLKGRVSARALVAELLARRPGR